MPSDNAASAPTKPSQINAVLQSKQQDPRKETVSETARRILGDPRVGAQALGQNMSLLAKR